MVPRERVIRAVTFGSPDRAPMRHNVTASAVIKHGETLLDILARYPDDFGTDTSYPEQMKQRQESGGVIDKDEERTDEWGCVWRYRQDGLLGQAVGHPLADWKALDSYEFPPVPEATPELVEEKRQAFSQRQQTHYVFGANCWLWERMQLLRGDVAIMMDLMDDRPEVGVLADRLFAYARQVFEPALKAGCDAVDIGDDWGNQNQLRIPPAVWRRFFRSRYESLFSFVHDHGAHVRFHSCGHILEIMPDLIEIGADIINIQSSCMPLDGLATVARGRVCLEVDIDRQYQMPHGTPTAVQRRTQACDDALSTPEGGLIWLTEIGPDVPLENVEAYYEACTHR